MPVPTPRTVLDLLYRFLDFFRPASIAASDEVLANRSRLSVGLAWFIGFETLAFAIAYPAIAPQIIPVTWALSYGLALSFLFMPWILRATGALGAVGVFLSVVPLVVVLFVAWNSHGIATPGLAFLPVPVLIGLGLRGGRMGALIALAAVIGVGVLAAADLSGWKAFPEIGPSPVLRLVVISFSVVMVIGIGWFYEITRIRTLARLSDALTAAEDANMAKREFLASMSHELRTPLNSVIGFAQVVRQKEELSSSGDHMLDRIHTSGLHLLGLVNQLLDVSKVEAGEIELRLEAVDVGELVRQTLNDLEGQKPREHVELIADLPPVCSPLRTDREKLRQIVVNLVVNAFKFTREGSVTVRLACQAAGIPCVLEVEDTGIGIPREKLEAIFERFVQVDTGTSRQFDGTGLGLSISKDLCDLMGYTLEVESEPGRGTRFRVGFSP